MKTETAHERFERVATEYRDAIWRLTAGYTRQPADREDLQQEILAALWRALPAFRGDCSERTFVYRVAHNRGVTFRARAQRRVASPLDTVAARPDPGPGPDEMAAAERLRARLQDAIRELPVSRSQVLMLSLERLSHREIAEVVGITENNVAVRLNRARNDLARILGETTEETT